MKSVDLGGLLNSCHSNCPHMILPLPDGVHGLEMPRLEALSLGPRGSLCTKQRAALMPVDTLK